MTDESIAADALFLPGDVVEFRLRTALQMLYDETVSYITLNNLGGMDNQCMRLAREALASPEVLRASSGSEDEERAAFEAAMKRNNVMPATLERSRHGNGYVFVNLAWLAWQARAALSPSGPMISLDAVAAGPRSPSQDQSTRNTPCQCRQCLRDRKETLEGFPHFPIEVSRMILCQTCGCKRCPHATDHRLVCTDSNDAGQQGSSYGVPLASSIDLDKPFDFRGLKRDEGPTADAATGTGNTQGTEP